MKIVKYVFTLIGLVMLIGSAFSIVHTRSFLAEAILADGVVVDLERSRSSDSTSYHPIVEFHTRTGELIEFRSSTGSNPPSYSRGEKVSVRYLEDRPEKAKIDSFFSLWGLPTILGGMGLIFFLVGFFIIRAGVRKKKRHQYLRDYGIPIKAAFQSATINTSYRVNGRSPYNIYAQWENPDTSKIHVFKSENIWFDPTDHIDVEEITVLIDKNNPKSYLVDISFLPEAAK